MKIECLYLFLLVCQVNDKHTTLLFERDSFNDSELLLAAVDMPSFGIDVSRQTFVSRTISSVNSEDCTNLKVQEKHELCGSRLSYVHSPDVLDLVDCLIDHCKSKTEIEKKTTEVTTFLRCDEDILTDDILWNIVGGESCTQVGQSNQRKASQCHNSMSTLTAVCKNLDSVLSVSELSTDSVKQERRAVGRLSDRIKVTLQKNAKVNTPVRQTLSHVLSIAEPMKVEGKCHVENQPNLFYGLPLIVKQLLEAHRSISSLYRKLLCCCLFSECHLSNHNILLFIKML